MSQAYLTANSYLGIMPEVTRGTLNVSGTPVYIPVTSPQVTEMQTFLRDEALRGSPVTTVDQVPGVRHDEYDAKFYVYADTFPQFVKGVLGGTDTVTGTGPYTHNIKLLNNASTGSQPQSYSIMDFDGANFFTMLGAQLDQVELVAGAEVASEATVKYIANPYLSGTTPTAPFSTPSLSTVHMIPGWETAVAIAGNQLNYVSELTLTIARKTAPIFTMGNQAPYTNFAGPIEVSGKLTAVVPSQSDIFSTGTTGYALTRSPQTLNIVLTDPNDAVSSTPYSVAFLMTSAQFQNVKRTRGKAYTELEVEFTASADVTDATTGYSPIQATIVNNTATAY